jgi:hypothetical protein
MKIKITQTRLVKEVINEKTVNLIENERFDKVDCGVMNCVKVAPLYRNIYDKVTFEATGEKVIHGYQFVYVNTDSIHTAKISLQDIVEGKAVKVGAYDFMYLLFENENTSYQIDRDFFEKVFKRFQDYYISAT